MFKRFHKQMIVGLLSCALIATAQAQTTWYVDDDAPNDPGPGNPDVSDPLEDGSTEHPYDTIQEAIDAAASGDEVVVHPGTYDIVDFTGKLITVRGTDPDDPDVVQTTIISGSQEYGTDTVVTASDGTLSGFTVRNGTIAICYGTYDTDAYSPTITHCLTKGCYYGIKGYVPYLHAPITPIFRNNIITGRLAGIWLDGQAFGGGVHALIQNNVIIGIEATYGRGIVYRMHESLPAVTGNIITDWSTGIELVYSSLAEQRKALITHNDVWGNTDNYIQGEQLFDMTGTQGNISADPLWVNQAAQDYHLLDGSPCVDAGDPDFTPAPSETDIDGDDRVQHCRVDIGPDESPYYRDCNENGIPDACETIDNGDFDADGDVDLDDFAAFTDCMAGPDLTPTPALPGCAGVCLAAFDLDDDDDLDLADFAAIQQLFTGS